MTEDGLPGGTPVITEPRMNWRAMVVVLIVVIVASSGP